MAPRIPEGYVFVPRRQGVNVALLLLNAAEKIGADRVLSVRTTTNGYNVHADVAAAYIEEHGEDAAEGVIDAPEASPVQIPGEATEGDLIAAFTSWGDQEDVGTEEEGEGESEDSDPATPTGDQTGDQGDPATPAGEEPAPLGVTADNTHAEIDDYAAKLDPPVDVSKAANKAEKIEILEHARTAPKTDPAA